MEDRRVDEFYNNHRGFRVFIGCKSIQENPNHRCEILMSKSNMLYGF